MASPSSRYDNVKESALVIGDWMTLHLREPVDGMFSPAGYIQYCSTYGVRLNMANGRVVYTPHTNIIGATGQS